MKKKKKNGIIIFFAVVFFPVTLMILLWKNKNLKSITKAYITAGVFFVCGVYNLGNIVTKQPIQSSETGTERTTTTTASVTATTTVTTTITTTSATTPATEPLSASEIVTRTPRVREYILNTNSGIYHRPSCTHAKKITEDHKLISTDIEWLKSNYSECGTCTP